ncbi:hypothetical protein DS885_03805 [Psychromonas sp. B3M02]|uniref:transglycosylase SLT domain-containing protein n=1 Tax=Psychromonas sp. B3M02 TaxID=2267226 RepID=UPI000DEAA5CC|nr:transglycosylase SLT domain-containing protein [Psychromonas sp. B3M02]RBW47281.1 hypothetical protein DS885_03805 [Psychromonas sp. B3M02]
MQFTYRGMIYYSTLLINISFFVLFSSYIKAVEIPPFYKKIAAHYQIPEELYYSIAMQESRRPKIGLPWPWTLNICGKGKYFNSQKEAADALKKALLDKCSVDIGLFQIHWQSHYDKFTSPEQALDPINNMNAAAIILTTERKRSKTNGWYEATGRYHSPGTKKLAESYRKSVYAILKKVQK